MKNSTLLRLFFISIGIPLTCASSSSTSSSSTSSSTSSTPTSSTPTSSTPTPSTPTPKPRPKSKPKTTSLLVDKTNTAPDVQLEGTVTEVSSVSGETSASGMEDTLSVFQAAWASRGNYGEVFKLACRMDNNKLLKHLSQVEITLDQFKDLFGYLGLRKMVPDFLAHGNMALVRTVIVETGLLDTDNDGECNSIYDAIALSLKEDRHDRVANLFEAAQKRPRWKDEFEEFVWGFFERYPLEKNSMPLKRFLTLYGEELSKEHHDIFEAICKELVRWLRRQIKNSASQKLLIDLVGQPSLLTPVAFVGGFLRVANDTYRASFIEYGYKEAIEEGLKEKYREGGRKLWAVMVKQFPTQLPEVYPSIDGTRTVALKDLPTKQGREEAWAEKNAQNPHPQTKLRARQLAKYLNDLGIDIPIVLWVIVAGYLTVPTWLDIE